MKKIAVFKMLESTIGDLYLSWRFAMTTSMMLELIAILKYIFIIL